MSEDYSPSEGDVLANAETHERYYVEEVDDGTVRFETFFDHSVGQVEQLVEDGDWMVVDGADDG